MRSGYQNYLRHGDDYEVNTRMPDFFGFVEDLMFELIEDAEIMDDPFGSVVQEAIARTVDYLNNTTNWGARGGYTTIATIKQSLIEDYHTARNR